MQAALEPLAELWRQRRLLGALVLRDLRSRYAGSSAGIFWAVANPLVQIVILTVVFSFVLQVRLAATQNAPFPVVLAWGLFPWIGIQEGVVRATTSLVESGVMIKRMAFRPGILLAQPVLSAAVHQVIALGLLVVTMPLLGVPLRATLPLCIVPFAVQIALTVGIGWILGVLHVYFRDTAQAVVAALQAWFYLTPIVYTLDTAPESLRRLLLINPLCGIVEVFRSLALGGPMAWGAFAWSVVAAALMLAAGARVLSYARAEIADLV
jgi:lipopolysaccharide transport system permease protein